MTTAQANSQGHLDFLGPAGSEESSIAKRGSGNFSGCFSGKISGASDGLSAGAAEESLLSRAARRSGRSPALAPALAARSGRGLSSTPARRSGKLNSR